MTRQALFAAGLMLGLAPLAAAQTAPPAAAPTLNIPASVEAFERTDLRPKVTGYVADLRADIGDSVAAGQVLAVIDVPELEQELAQARADHAARQAAEKLAAAAILSARAKLEVARKQLLPAEAEAKYRTLTLNRKKELLAGKAIPDQDVDEAQARCDTAAAAVAIAHASIAAAESDLAAAQAGQQAAAAQVAVAAAAAQVAVAAAAVKKYEAMVRYTKIVAPYDGVVTRRLVHRGALVQAATGAGGQPIFTVERIDRVRVFADVPESDISRVSVGAAASVTPFALADKSFSGTVTRTAGSLNPATRTLRVEIDLPNPDRQLLHGMYAQVSFTLSAPAAAAR